MAEDVAVIISELNKNIRLTLVADSDVQKIHFCPTTVGELESCGYLRVDGSIPSNFELDLLRAGIIDDPFYSTNSIKMQRWECMHLWYHTRFAFDGVADANTYLVFEGIDTVADIYLNGQKIGHVENMHIKHEFNVADLRAENELVVHILPAAVFARQRELPALCNGMPYNVDALSLRKSISMFGWDIMPRLVSAGLYKRVYVEQKPSERIENLYLFATEVSADGTARLNATYFINSRADVLQDLDVEISGACGDSNFCMRQRAFNANGRMFCKQAFKLWYPKGYGEQSLYDVTARLYRGDDVVFEQKLRFGVRSVELQRTSTVNENGGKFQFIVNGLPVFIMGTNWVPLSPYTSQSKQRLGKALALLDDIGCNAVRCWGGGVYEDDEFYRFCDEKGILVWQDFMMACGIYPQDECFSSQLAHEAEQVVKRLRNHPSLLLWAGDNECDWQCLMDGFGANPNDNALTRELLRSVVARHDCTRPYLPSSPFIDEHAFASGEPLSEEHLWGPRDYFKGEFYRNAKAAFASEIGYHGCPSVQSLRRFISAEKLWPIVQNGKPNDDWIAHATATDLTEGAFYHYRIDLMMSHVKTLFGRVPESLDEFVLLSQASQAEAKKYFIERFRIKKGGTSGIIWWNLLDGWPQISDAVVDYYFDKKLAYGYIKRAQQPVCFMLDEPVEGVCALVGVNDTFDEFCGTIVVRNVETAQVVFEGAANIAGNGNAVIGEIDVGQRQACYHIEWYGDGCNGENHYYAGMPNLDAEQYVAAMQKIGFIDKQMK